jgi:hypothetical protein
MFQDTTRVSLNDSYIGELRPKTSRARGKRRAKKQVNWRSSSSAKTLEKQLLIRELLATGLSFSVRAIGEALGISRQLALYHVKKMAASAQLVMVLEPCERNGGLQYRVWDESALMAHYMLRGQRVMASRGAERAA